MKKMQKVSNWILTVLGFIILLSAIALHAFSDQIVHLNLGANTFIIDKSLLVIAACVIGIGLIISGACGLFIKKTKQIEIEEQDERNILIANMAKASGFGVMSCLYSVVTVILSFTGSINTTAFFTLLAVFVIGQIVFISRLWYLQKHM